MNVAQKHHYVPIFYLKQWAGSDGRLVEFSRPRSKLNVRRKHPSGTAYVRGLYAFANIPIELTNVFETEFLSAADSTAADALRLMVDRNIVPTGRLKASWVRFILTMIHRTPEALQRLYGKVDGFYSREDFGDLQDEYEKLRSPTDPASPAEYIRQNAGMSDRSKISVLLNAMQSERTGNRLMQMKWHLGWFDNLRHQLLTSDRPLIMTNGIGRPNSHIAMPLSPRHLLCIAGTNEEAQKIIALSRNGELAKISNDLVVRQARKFAYDTDDRQMRFVDNRLGECIPCSPFE